MILQVAADGGAVHDALDALLLEVLLGADAGDHEHLRAVNGARCEDHLATRFHTARARRPCRLRRRASLHARL